MRRRLLPALLAASLCACASDRFSLDALLGGPNLPSEQLQAIRAVNETRGDRMAFRTEATDALDATRRAIRELATCDYESWWDGAIVVAYVSWIADKHESSLVRAEGLDTLTRMAPWTFAAVVPTKATAEWSDVIEAGKVLDDAARRTDEDPELTSRVEHAVTIFGLLPLQKVESSPSGRVLNAVEVRSFGEDLSSVRGALTKITARSLARFRADPGVLAAFDRAYVSLAASAIRLTLMKAVLADESETTRVAALRDLATIAPPGGAAVLGRVLAFDGYSSVRREAAKALASYPVPLAVPALIDGLSDEMTDVRQAAARSLAGLTGEHFGDDRRAWTRWWSAKSAGGVSLTEPGK